MVNVVTLEGMQLLPGVKGVLLLEGPWVYWDVTNTIQFNFELTPGSLHTSLPGQSLDDHSHISELEVVLPVFQKALILTTSWDQGQCH